MNRFLALSLADRRQAFEATSAAHGLPRAALEKDFWVCLTLRELFALPDIGEHLTFKGGTSLSKAWGLIDRFSEDIDLTLDRDILGFGGDASPERAKSRKEQGRRLEALKKTCRASIHEIILPRLSAGFSGSITAGEKWSLVSDDDDHDHQTLLFQYPRHGGAEAPGYLKPAVKLEFGARSDPWPVEPRVVSSIIAQEFPGLFEAPEALVRALLPERTFWEKVMLLHEETFRPAGKPRRARLARHYYDLWRLIEAGVAARALADEGLFERVAAHRQVYFKQSWVDYTTHRRGKLRLVPLRDQENEWRADYDTMRGEMFAGTPPPFEVILAVVGQFEQNFNRG